MFAVYKLNSDTIRVRVSVVNDPYGWYATSNNAS